MSLSLEGSGKFLEGVDDSLDDLMDKLLDDSANVTINQTDDDTVEPPKPVNEQPEEPSDDFLNSGINKESIMPNNPMVESLIDQPTNTDLPAEP